MSWKSFRYRLEALACRMLLLRGIPRLSRRAVVKLGNALGALAYLLDARSRPVALANLECAFGERFSAAERRRIVRDSYRNFARTMLDLFWGQRLTRENFREWIEMSGFDEMRERLAKEKRGAVFVCVHQGNWEWASLAFGFIDLPTIIVAENFKNPQLTETFSAARQHTGHTIIPQESSFVRMLKITKRGGFTGMLIDLSLRPSKAATVIGAFGDPERAGDAAGNGGLLMCSPLLHGLIAQRAGVMLVPVESQPLPDGRCRVIAHPPVEYPEGASVREIAQRCWDALEPVVRARPAEYLWPYKHFRYRPEDAAREYPFYANRSSKFEKLRAEAVKQ